MFLGAGEIVVVLAVALMVLGPKKMPEVARRLARFVAQARRITDEVRSQVDDALAEPQQPPTPTPQAILPSPHPDAPAAPGHDGPRPHENQVP